MRNDLVATTVRGRYVRVGTNQTRIDMYPDGRPAAKDPFTTILNRFVGVQLHIRLPVIGKQGKKYCRIPRLRSKTVDCRLSQERFARSVGQTSPGNSYNSFPLQDHTVCPHSRNDDCHALAAWCRKHRSTAFTLMSRLKRLAIARGGDKRWSV